MSAIAVPLPALAAPASAPSTRWELRKLRAQKRTYIGLGAAMLVPLDLHRRAADRATAARRTSRSGATCATPAWRSRSSALFFGSIWFFPLVTSLVAGDIVAAEDGNGTLKTILTRSVERWQIFAAKVLAALSYTFAALVALRRSSVSSSAGCSGASTRSSRSRATHISVGRGLALIAAVGARVLPADDRHRLDRAAALDGDAQLRRRGRRDADDLADHAAARRDHRARRSCIPYLLSEQFNAWQGFLREPIDWAPIVRAAWVSAVYAVPALAIAFTAFLRRDVAGRMIDASRRRGRSRRSR